MTNKERFGLTEPFVNVPEDIEKAFFVELPLNDCHPIKGNISWKCDGINCYECVINNKNPNRAADIARIKEVLERENVELSPIQKYDVYEESLNHHQKYKDFYDKHAYDPTKGMEQFVEGVPKIIMQEMYCWNCDGENNLGQNLFVFCWDGQFIQCENIAFDHCSPIQPKEEPKEERLTRPEILKVLRNGGVWVINGNYPTKEYDVALPTLNQSQDKDFRLCANWQDDPSVDKFLEPTRKNFEEYL